MTVIPDPVLDVLRCPVCEGGLHAVGRTFRCAAGHSFDVARQGYVNLLSGGKRAGTADTAEMVEARAGFLSSGHYDPIAEAVTDLAEDTFGQVTGSATGGASEATGELAGPGIIVDVGAGTGFYLSHILERIPEAYGVAADVSPYALRRAARAHPRAAAIGADAWRGLPIQDGRVSVLLDIFAPRNAAEFSRVLHPSGALVVVTPLRDHLAELIARFGMLQVDDRKEERVETTLAGSFMLEDRQHVTFPMRLTAQDVARLVRMGPSAHHLDRDLLETELGTISGRLDVTASVLVARYRLPA